MKKYVENDTPHTIYVGGMAIAPGEGREVNVPEEAPAEAPADVVADPDADMRALLAGNIASVIASLQGLGQTALERMAQLENEGKARKGVLTALADARIALADEKLKSDDLGDDGDEESSGGGDPGTGRAESSTPTE